MATSHQFPASTFTDYFIGFSLAFLLTGLAFGLTWLAKGIPAPFGTELSQFCRWLGEFNGNTSKEVARVGIFTLAILQLLVHFRYFLHLKWSSSNYYKITVLVFTLVIILIMIFGSLWVIFDLKRMMS